MRSSHTMGGDFLRHSSLFSSFAAVTLLLAGCSTTPSIGGGSSTAATGSASGGTSAGANSQLESCAETLGTIRIDEQTSSSWYGAYSSTYRTGSTVPALRLLIQQSNCFVIVDRGRGLQSGNQERAISRSEEGRAGSNFGGGQIAAADYTMIPEVVVSDRGGTRGGAGLAGLGSLFGSKGAVAGAVASSFSTNEAGTILTLIDNRSSVQLAAAEGYSKNVDFGGIGGLLGSSAAGGAGVFTSTPQGKVLLASFMDAYNKMVQSVRNYQAQTVKGGLGTGGRLGVQGGSTPASKEAPTPVKKK